MNHGQNTHSSLPKEDLFGPLGAAPAKVKVKSKPPLNRSPEERRQCRLSRKAVVDQAEFDAFAPKCAGTPLGDLTDRVSRYASGVLSPTYWSAYRAAGRALCVAATELGEATLGRACTHVSRGGTLLIDSGAFVYRGRPKHMPWAKVQAIYQRIANSASDDARLTFILPDAVGDQAESLDALSAWGNRLIEAVGSSHEVLLPIQRGNLKPSLYVDHALALLDYPISGVAIPCKASAFPVAYLSDLANITSRIPRRAHFLGISNDRKRLERYVYNLHRAWPEAEVTCDAVEHRAMVGQGEALTELRHEILDGPITDAALNTWDYADDPNDEVVAETRRRLKRLMGIDEHCDAEDEDTVDQMMSSQMATHIETSIRVEQVKSAFGARATAMATHAMAQGREPKLLTTYWQRIEAES